MITNYNELFADAPASDMIEDAAAGNSTLEVQSIAGFATNQIVLIGELGDEGSEIAYTHADTAPTGNTITLSATLVKPHTAGTNVYVLGYDQVEISTATTLTGTKTVLNLINIDPELEETPYDDSEERTGYYFIRFYNSLTDSYGEYSDPAPVGGWSDYQVAAVIFYALKRNKLTTFTDTVDYDFCLDEINACLKYIRGKLKKWHKLQVFDYSLGKLASSVNAMALPSDCWKYSNKSILSVRVGTGEPLPYKDKKEFEQALAGVPHTTLQTGIVTSGVTSMVLANSGDFAAAGKIKTIYGMEITYTENDYTTNTLYGIPASGDGMITDPIPAGSDVWQNAEESAPEAWTIVNGNLLFYPLAGTAVLGQNVWIDYWKEAPQIDSDADDIGVDRYDMVKHWLTWAIRAQVKNDGKRDFEDGDWKMFADILKDAIDMELKTHGQKYKTTPRLNTIQH